VTEAADALGAVAIGVGVGDGGGGGGGDGDGGGYHKECLMNCDEISIRRTCNNFGEIE